MGEPIEITEKDLIERPAIGTPAAPGQGGFNPMAKIKEIKGIIEQVKEAKEIMESMGITLNLPGLKLGGGQGQGGKEPPEPKQLPPPGPAQQFKALMGLLQMQYGDITVAELLDRLKADFGKKRISELGPRR